MKLKIIDGEFSVCRLYDISDIDLKAEYTFVSITDEEISLVCRTDKLPDNTEVIEYGWKGFRIEGVLDFSLIGILSDISAILAENNISIFAVSTYNTDYVFVKQENFEKAIERLKERKYIFN